MRYCQFVLIVLLGLACKNVSPGSGDSTILGMDDLEKMLVRDQKIHVVGATLKDKVDFTELGKKYAISKSGAISEISFPVYFENCTFLKEVVGYKSNDQSQLQSRFRSGISFEGCVFKNDFDFTGVIVEGPSFFRSNVFQRDVNITGANFAFHFSFAESIVRGNWSASYTLFQSKADFRKSEFHSSAFFQGAGFSDDAIFTQASFFGNADFTLNQNRGDLFFGFAVFEGKTWFNGSKWYGRTEFNRTKFSDTVQFKNLTTSSVVVTDGSEFFQGADVEGNFTNYKIPFEIIN